MPKGRKNTKTRSYTSVKRDLQFKEHMQEYATITKVLGGRNFNVSCSDSTERIAIVRTKRMRISLNDVVLVSLRDFDNRRCDIIWLYNADEVRSLVKLKEYTPVKKSEDCDSKWVDAEDLIEFTYDSDSVESDDHPDQPNHLDCDCDSECSDFKYLNKVRKDFNSATPIQLPLPLESSGSSPIKKLKTIINVDDI